MGCFDSIYARCPECGDKVEFQTKAGECMLEKYTLPNAPHDLLLSIDGDKEKCPKGHTVQIKVQSIVQGYAVIAEDC